MTEQPTTAAGRTLLRHGTVASDPTMLLDILAIEAAARQQDGLALRTGLEAIRDTSTDHASRQLADSMLHALAVLPPSTPPARWQDATTDEWDAAANAHRNHIRLEQE